MTSCRSQGTWWNHSRNCSGVFRRIGEYARRPSVRTARWRCCPLRARARSRCRSHPRDGSRSGSSPARLRSLTHGAGTVVMAGVHEVMQAERRHVVDHRLARTHHHRRPPASRSAASLRERHAHPLLGDGPRGQHADPTPGDRRRTSWPGRSASRSSCDRRRCSRRRPFRCACSRAARRRSTFATVEPLPFTSVSASQRLFEQRCRGRRGAWRSPGIPW